MRPPDRRQRETPATTAGGSRKNSSTTTEPVESVDEGTPTVADLADKLRRRRAASLRLAPFDDGFRDPLGRLASPPGPSDFGLCRSDLLAEVGRCVELGWADWELVARFTDPKQVAA